MGRNKGSGARPLADRLWERVDREGDGGCWLWLGPTRDGYGRIGSGGKGAPVLLTHRVAYELLVGPIPDGLTLDHLCRVRGCCNPAHLEPVTVGENARRGLLKDECIHGHAYDEENTYLTAQGHKRCRRCARERERRVKGSSPERFRKP